ncbi:ash2-trithorax family protein [Botrytis cinerea]
MSVDGQSPRRGSISSANTPILPPASAFAQKRALEDDHQPAVSSPLNPEFKVQKTGDETPGGIRERASRAKKESLKKRESKAGSLAPEGSARATPDPRSSSSSKKKAVINCVTPLRYKIPPPKLPDFEAPRGPTLVPSHTKTTPDGTEIQFHETTDQRASARVAWARSNGFARREAAQDAPVGFDAYSYGIRDVAGQKVWMSRPKDFFPAGESIYEGDVIGLEINLPSEKLHRKVVEGNYNPAVDLTDEDDGGMERADMIRDRVPIRFKTHLYFEQIEYSTCKELEELMNPSPVISSTGGVASAIQDPGPTHPVPALRTLPHSSIKVYQNGKLIGTPFTDLLSFLPHASKPQPQVGAREGLDDGMLGYFPAVSVFRGGAAEVNFGPQWWYPPSGLSTEDGDVDMVNDESSLPKLRAASDRYDEQIVEDILYDIVDEVDFWIRDGGIVGRVKRGIYSSPTEERQMAGTGRWRCRWRD